MRKGKGREGEEGKGEGEEGKGEGEEGKGEGGGGIKGNETVPDENGPIYNAWGLLLKC